MDEQVDMTKLISKFGTTVLRKKTQLKDLKFSPPVVTAMNLKTEQISYTDNTRTNVFFRKK